MPWRTCTTPTILVLSIKDTHAICSVLNETLRWFPPVVDIPKESAEDTTFNITNAAGEKATIPVPRGACVTLCVPSLHNTRTSPFVFPFSPSSLTVC